MISALPASLVPSLSPFLNENIIAENVDKCSAMIVASIVLHVTRSQRALSDFAKSASSHSHSKKTGVKKEPPTERLRPGKVDVNSEDHFKNMWLGDSYTDEEGHHHHEHGSIHGHANAKMTIEGCHLEGLEKESNGHVTIRNTYIFGDEAMDFGGNNHVEMYNCVIVGKHVAATIGGNVHFDAHDCFFIATGEPRKKRATAIELEGNAKAELHHCVVTSSTGIVCKGNSKLKAKHGSISCQKTKILSGLFSNFFAIAGKNETEDVKVKGPVTVDHRDAPPRAKLTSSGVSVAKSAV